MCNKKNTCEKSHGEYVVEDYVPHMLFFLDEKRRKGANKKRMGHATFILMNIQSRTVTIAFLKTQKGPFYFRMQNYRTGAFFSSL